MVDRKFVVGAALAAGSVFLIPGVAAALARAARPLVKATIKTGATAYEEFRHAGAEAFEHIEDIVAEVRAELDEDGAEATDTLNKEVKRAAKKAAAATEVD